MNGIDRPSRRRGEKQRETDRDAADPHSARDFGRDIIPYLVANAKAVAHRFTESCVRAADEIMAFETALAKASRALEDLRDPQKNYNPMTPAAPFKVCVARRMSWIRSWWRGRSSTIVVTSTRALRPRCQVTTAMSASEAMFTPSRTPPANGASTCAPSAAGIRSRASSLWRRAWWRGWWA